MGTIGNETLGRASAAVHEYKNNVMGAVAQMEKLTHDAGEMAGDVASELPSKIAGYVKASGSYIQENPGKSVAFATVGGLVVGSLVTLLIRRQK